MELQKKYGGVYPIEAKRQHEKVIDAVVEEAMWRAKRLVTNLPLTKGEREGVLLGTTPSPSLARRGFSVNAVAVTVGPGLAPALEVGIRKAKELAVKWNVPLIAVNHMEGHLLAPLAQNAEGGGRWESNSINLPLAKGELEGVLLENTPNPALTDEITVKTSRLPRVQNNFEKIMDILKSSTVAKALADRRNDESSGSWIGIEITHPSGETNERQTTSRPSLQKKRILEFPVLGLLVSGGHTEIVLMREIGNYELLGAKLDDAAGECLDKVARMLGLGYPGGAVIEELAKQGRTGVIKFPIPMKGKPGFDFSFSGVKTAALYEIRQKSLGGGKEISRGDNEKVGEVQWGRLENLDRQYICDVCLAVQETVIKALIYRLEQAVEIYKPKWVFLGGGVGANVALRRALRKMLKKHGVKLGVPYSDKLYGDNAGMIGLVASFKLERSEFEDIEKVERQPRLRWK